MKWHKTKCVMCGKEIPYFDINNVPKVCESKLCQTNYRYQQKHRDLVTGKVPKAESITKW